MTDPTGRQWASRLGFVLSASGSAVGLGNVWKFPYVAGTNGGGLWILIVVVFLLIIGLPVLVAEIGLGRRHGSNMVSAYKTAFTHAGPLKWTGCLSLAGAVIVLSFYSVVGGWVLHYTLQFLQSFITQSAPSTLPQLFNQHIQSPHQSVVWSVTFLMATSFISFFGIAKGIERWNKFAMPCLIVLMVGMIVSQWGSAGFYRAMEFLFVPDWRHLSFKSVIEAMGHAFFTLSLGVGAICVYGSYLGQKDKIGPLALSIVFIDLVVALLASILVFSVAFNGDAEPTQGPKLVFETLSAVFFQIDFGIGLGLIFFLVLSFAALTSSVSMLEPFVVFIASHFQTKRRRAIVASTFLIGTLGIVPSLSFNLWGDVQLFNLGLFDIFDKTVSVIIMPVVGFILCLGGGLKRLRADYVNEVGFGNFMTYVLNICLKLLAPVSIFVIFVSLVLKI